MNIQNYSDSAREKAYRTAFDAISAMRLGEDGFIREDELVERSGVSRTPVREALHRLQAEGLVRLVPRKGAYVSAVSPHDIQELLECRSLFEEFAADSIIEDDQGETIARLEALLDEQWQAWRDGAPQARLMQLDQTWHATLVAASRNRLLSEIYQSLKNRELRLMLTVISVVGPNRWKQALEEHTEILKELRAGNKEGARAAIVRHCQQTGQSALSARWSGAATS